MNVSAEHLARSLDFEKKSERKGGWKSEYKKGKTKIKMRTGMLRLGNKTYIDIEFSRVYEYDYKIYMLKENDISGLLSVSSLICEGKSKYRYGMIGMNSIKQSSSFGR